MVSWSLVYFVLVISSEGDDRIAAGHEFCGMMLSSTGRMLEMCLLTSYVSCRL